MWWILRDMPCSIWSFLYMKIIYNKKLNWDQFLEMIINKSDSDGITRNLLVRKCKIYEVPKGVTDLNLGDFLPPIERAIIKNCHFYSGLEPYLNTKVKADVLPPKPKNIWNKFLDLFKKK